MFRACAGLAPENYMLLEHRVSRHHHLVVVVVVVVQLAHDICVVCLFVSVAKFDSKMCGS